jgi:two-component system LytT family response regulator
MKTFTSFVVDDNPNALGLLISDIKNHYKDLKILGKATSVVSAAKELQIINPDILLLDIMLGDGTGFDILELCPKLKSKVIFITASEEYALKAFKFAAIDYILKPYSIKELSTAIEKAKEQITPEKEQIEVLKELIEKPYHKPSKISLHTSEKITIIDINNIIRCQSDSNYTIFYLKNKDKILVSKTLKYYYDILKTVGFIRVHQSHLVNKQYIKEYIKSDGGYLLLKDNSTIPISTRKRSEILGILKKM